MAIKRNNNIDNEIVSVKCNNIDGVKVYDIYLRNFVSNQSKIMKKYLPKLDGYTDFEILDKYFMQILEELYEVQIADGRIESYKEIIDVIMYLGSTVAFLEFKIDNEDEKLERHVIYDFKENITLSKFIDRVFKSIFRCRRLFDERKWHKPIRKLNESQLKDNYRFCLEELFSTMIMGLVFLSNEDENTRVNIIDLIKSKQDFIKEL